MGYLGIDDYFDCSPFWFFSVAPIILYILLAHAEVVFFCVLRAGIVVLGVKNYGFSVLYMLHKDNPSMSNTRKPVFFFLNAHSE
jgi:hypothetical protein